MSEDIVSLLDVQQLSTGAITRLKITWPEVDWRHLYQYLEAVDAVAKTPIMKNGFRVHMEVAMGKGTGHGITTRLPDMDAVRLLLHKLRPLILKDEPTSFVKMRKLVSERVGDESIRTLLKFYLELYDGRVSRSVVKIMVDGILLNSEEFLQTWLNAHEYHRDEDKQKEIAELDAAYPEEGSRAIWLSMLVDKCKAIRNLAGIIACIVGRQKELSSEIIRIMAVSSAA